MYVCATEDTGIRGVCLQPALTVFPFDIFALFYDLNLKCLRVHMNLCTYKRLLQHWLGDIQKSLWHEMNGQFWQAAPQSSFQDFPKALPFCYVQYLQLYCLCVLIIVCDSWQVYKRYTINLPIECSSVQVSEILYPVFPTYGEDTGKRMALLLLSADFLLTLERMEHSDSVMFESTLKAFIELARIEHVHHKPAHLGGF